MAWIRTISKESAKGKLASIYKRVAGPDGQVDNILQAHSLRPHTLKGHMVLYKNVLHHVDNSLPKWFLETIGVYVSILNQCQYCIDHHVAGLKTLVGEERCNDIVNALYSTDGKRHDLTAKEWAALSYSKSLTELQIGEIKSSVNSLQRYGYDDGEILEINQVVSYFCYANRTVLGLGVVTDGETLGLSPNSSSSEDWSHR